MHCHCQGFHSKFYFIIQDMYSIQQIQTQYWAEFMFNEMLI